MLLTDDAIFDVVYMDVLKGQNFAQTTTGPATLQNGSPFHFHTSVHSPTGFTSSATLQSPTGGVKTLTQQNGSPNYLSRDESFTTKSLLDAAYAFGNYKPTIMHPLSVQFSPSLDVSAAAGQSVTFDSQVVAPNSSGVFHEVWSPITPAVDVDGTVTATHFSATLKGHTNASLTGTISADWNGTQYVGTYSFNGATGNVSIPEAIATTLSLPADAYPNAPHITDFTAAQTLNPAANFTLTWDAFAGGAADDLITLFIFDGNNQVFHTDAIPLPTSSPHLDGTATSFVLPKNTLLANKTYNAQLWFTNFTSIDTTSFPGAKATTGYYIATNFTIKTGTAVDTSPADVVGYYVSKAQEFVQEGAGAPVLNTDDLPYLFVAHVEERESVDGTVLDSTIKIPGSLEDPPDLFQDGAGGWDYSEEFDTKSELDALYKSGKYTFAIDTFNQGLKSPAVTLPTDAYPVTPHISNWADAQMIDATAAFTLTWDAFTGGTTDDFIQVSIGDDLSAPVFETPDFWEANALNGTARSVVIPAGTFIPGEIQTVRLLFANTSTIDRTTYKGAIGTAAYSKFTTFSVSTIPAEGLLQFSAANFSAAETAGFATITVNRIGGSEGEVTVDYSMTDGTATDGSDYTKVNGTLTFGDGITSQTFQIPILDDTNSEGNETVSLTIDNPDGGAGLATRVTATLTILDDELLFGPGNFVDSDGDKYTVALSGPGTARIALDDPDGDGKGPIKAIILANTTNTTSLSLTVTKALTGDGKISIGRVTGSGGLSSLSAAKADLIGSGINLGGVVGSITLDRVLNGADLIVGGALTNSTKFTLGDVAAGTEIHSGATIGTLTAQSFLGEIIQAPAIDTLTINTGALTADLAVTNAIKTLTLKKGAASGDWTASNFGTVSITGGGFTGTLRATASAAQLKTTPSVSSLSITGGDLKGLLSGLAAFSTLSVKKDLAGNGGSVLDTTLSAKSLGTVTIGKNLVHSLVLAGANLGLNQVVGGTGANADTFGDGSIGTFTVGGFVDASVVGAGLDPFGEIFHNGNDVVIGDKNSPLKLLTITGTASADSYFRAGLLPTSVKIGGASIDPKNDSRFRDVTGLADADTTDADGNVTLEINGYQVPFQILDETNGQGIPGLIVVATTNTGIEGLGLLEIFDPTDQYPFRMVTLQGEPDVETSSLTTPPTRRLQPPVVLYGDSGSAPQSAADEPEAPEKQIISYVGEQIESIKILPNLPFLPKLKKVSEFFSDGTSALVKLAESVGYAAVYADIKFSGRLSQHLADNGLLTRPRQVSKAEAKQLLIDSLNQFGGDTTVIGGMTVFGAPDTDQSVIPTGGGFYANDPLGLSLALQAIENHDGPLYYGRVVDGSFISFGSSDEVFPPATAPLNLSNENPQDRIEFFSNSNKDKSLGFQAVIGNGNLTIPVGDYVAVEHRAGQPVVTRSVTVPPEGITLPTTPRPQIASLILDMGTRPTGPLDPGTQVRFTVTAKDSNGNVIPSNQIDLTCLSAKIFNPTDLSGEKVATFDTPQLAIDPNTGMLTVTLTVGKLNGSARVSVRTCDGVSSNSIMIPGLGITLFNLPIISFESTAVSVTEGTGAGTTFATFTLRLNKTGTKPVSVTFNTQNLTATSPSDYQSTVNTVVFSGTTATIRIPIVRDNITESNEKFVLGLLKPVNARLDVSITATCTIIDDDAALLSIADVKKNEGNSGTTNFVFTVKLSTPNSKIVTVDFTTADGTASQSSDYTSTSGTLTFQPGETSKSITVAVRGDLDIESDETFFVKLSNPVQATLGNVQATGTITNDDQLRAGQVIIRIVGNGYVTDSTGQIDTRVGRNSAIYAPNTFPFLHASSPFVVWSDPSFFTQDPPLSDNNFRNGLILTAFF